MTDCRTARVAGLVFVIATALLACHPTTDQHALPDGGSDSSGDTLSISPPSCGDGTCTEWETTANCPVDCGRNNPTEYCGDGVCAANESTASCVQDCGSFCGDGTCNGSESTTTCSQDCGANTAPDSCGDGKCSGEETTTTCAQDCGQPPGPATAPLNYTCAAIGTSSGDGFFALKSYQGHLYAGQFGYGLENQSMLYKYPNWTPTSPGLTGIGESVCALHEFNGKLYANTENSGDIFVSSDGNHWSKTYDGPAASIGCGLAEFQGQLYALNYQNGNKTHGRVLRRDGDGWTTVFDSGNAPLYLRELVAYNGMLYVFGVQDGQGQMLATGDGNQWQQTAVANRYLRGHVFNGYLWLGSTDMSAPSSTVGIFRFDGTNFVQKHASTQRYVTQIRALDGVLFAGTSSGWKEASGPSSLLMSTDSGESWSAVCAFPEAAVWDVAVHDGTIFLGTWQWGGHGRVMRVTASTEAPPPTPQPTVNCALIAQANSAWQVCETGAQFCAGPYTDGAGCQAYCAAAGMVCTARFGGEPGCQKEPNYPIPCDENNTHQSDWCECGPANGTVPTPPPTPSPNPVSLDGDCTPSAGSLDVGQTQVVAIDAFSGDEDTTQPKIDANNGQSGDNPQYRRHNVARGHGDYWYTSSFQKAGEPDPNSPQWVDYTPNFSALGVGCYQITGQYRATENRANYIVDYKVMNSAAGDVIYKEVQKKGNNEYLDVHIGTHQLCSNSYLRIQDPGGKSITFNKVRFQYVGPTCP